LISHEFKLLFIAGKGYSTIKGKRSGGQKLLLLIKKGRFGKEALLGITGESTREIHWTTPYHKEIRI